MQYERLVKAARKVKRNAYAPYSHFFVGAALLASDGRVYVGCNVVKLKDLLPHPFYSRKLG